MLQENFLWLVKLNNSATQLIIEIELLFSFLTFTFYWSRSSYVKYSIGHLMSLIMRLSISYYLSRTLRGTAACDIRVWSYFSLILIGKSYLLALLWDAFRKSWLNNIVQIRRPLPLLHWNCLFGKSLSWLTSWDV